VVVWTSHFTVHFHSQIEQTPDQELCSIHWEHAGFIFWMAAWMLGRLLRQASSKRQQERGGHGLHLWRRRSKDVFGLLALWNLSIGCRSSSLNTSQAASPIPT